MIFENHVRRLDISLNRILTKVYQIWLIERILTRINATTLNRNKFKANDKWVENVKLAKLNNSNDPA